MRSVSKGMKCPHHSTYEMVSHWPQRNTHSCGVSQASVVRRIRCRQNQVHVVRRPRPCQQERSPVAVTPRATLLVAGRNINAPFTSR